MRKNAALLFLSLFLPVFFACQIPKAIEIIGTPSARFAETVDIGKMFTDLLKDAINKDDKLTIIPCPKTEIITYLIHAELFNEEFDAVEHEDELGYLNFPGMELLPGDIGVTLTSDKVLIDGSNDRMTLPLSEVGSLLEGFEFTEYVSKLYFSGSPLIKKSKVKIIIEEIDVIDGTETYTLIKSIEEGNITNKGSDIKTWEEDKEYKETACPSDGIEIDIPIIGKDIAVSFKVYIPAGEILYLDDFEAGNINIEVVVWLPFKFTAIDDDAALSFPDGSFFKSDEDLFGREEPDSESMIFDIIESISVDVKFHNNPFDGADLIIYSKGVAILNPIEDTLSFTISEKDMKEINKPENWPFTPNIKIGFAEGETLSFPREFNAFEFAFKAKVHYRKDFF